MLAATPDVLLLSPLQLKKEIREIQRLERGREIDPRKLPKGWKLCTECFVVYNVSTPICNCGKAA